MKQILPFVIIAALIGGAMYFLNDDYQEAAYDPDWTDERSVADWEVTLFLNNGSGSDRDIGIHLEYTGFAEEPDIDALEVFYITEYGNFFYQDLNIEEFNKEILYSEPCGFCAELEGENVNGELMLSWRQNGQARHEYLQMYLYLEDE